MFTKGKWEARGWLIVDENEVLIADCRVHRPTSVFESYISNGNTPVTETTANAQLIASAPDLYEALKEVKQWLYLMHANIPLHGALDEQIDKALDKAEK